MMWNLQSYPTTVLNERIGNLVGQNILWPLLHIFRVSGPQPSWSAPDHACSLFMTQAGDLGCFKCPALCQVVHLLSLVPETPRQLLAVAMAWTWLDLTYGLDKIIRLTTWNNNFETKYISTRLRPLPPQAPRPQLRCPKHCADAEATAGQNHLRRFGIGPETFDDDKSCWRGSWMKPAEHWETRRALGNSNSKSNNQIFIAPYASYRGADSWGQNLQGQGLDRHGQRWW